MIIGTEVDLITRQGGGKLAVEPFSFLFFQDLPEPCFGPSAQDPLQSN